MHNVAYPCFARCIGAAVALAVALGAAQAQELAPRGSRGAGDPPPGSIADELRRRDDNAFITVTGTVKAAQGEIFMLSDGRTEIAVEFDRAKWGTGAERIEPGHRVTVYGETDKDLFERRTIEASMVYDHDIGRFFYADEEDEEASFRSVPKEKLSDRLLTYGLAGTVAKIDGRELTLRTVGGTVTVDMRGLGDAAGANRPDTGERVVVYGTFDDRDAFDARKIRATAIERMTR